ncbi:MAG TPA: hypothetical protein VFC78_22405 [Tepidisphaeraceae bacterium]|nr:hypothetical protein [Tepidisphaeraceae bacterium]
MIEALESRQLLSADLTGLFAGHVPAALPPGGMNHLSVVVRNVGDSPAKGPVTVQLYASADPTLDTGSDVLLGSATRGINIKAAGRAPVNIRFASPAGLGDGSFYLIAKVTGGAGIGDTNTANDVVTASAPVTIRQPFVNLVTQFSRLPLQPGAANGVLPGSNAVVRITNAGNSAARGEATVSWFLSKDQVLDSGDLLLASAPPRRLTLAPGASTSFSARIHVPGGTAVGTYFLLAQVNAGNGIADVNPMTNVAVSPPILVVNAVAPTIGSPQRKNDNSNNNNNEVLAPCPYGSSYGTGLLLGGAGLAASDYYVYDGSGGAAAALGDNGGAATNSDPGNAQSGDPNQTPAVDPNSGAGAAGPTGDSGGGSVSNGGGAVDNSGAGSGPVDNSGGGGTGSDFSGGSSSSGGDFSGGGSSSSDSSGGDF